jgi:Na+/serine symporter
MTWGMPTMVRRLIAFGLIVSLAALGTFALAAHTHADNGFHQGCEVCKAAVVSHATIVHLAMVPEHPLRATDAQVGNWYQVAVVRLCVEPSSPRAPPLS